MNARFISALSQKYSNLIHVKAVSDEEITDNFLWNCVYRQLLLAALEGKKSCDFYFMLGLTSCQMLENKGYKIVEHNVTHFTVSWPTT